MSSHPSGRTPRPRIDAHQHFWDLGSGRYDWPTIADGPIHRSFGPEDLEPELLDAGIDRTVLVQATDSLEDTDAMLRVARAYPFVAGVVGWVPLLDRGRAEAELAARHGRLCGIRHLIHREADPEWLLRPDADAGLDLLGASGIPFDVVAVFPDHLPLVPLVAERHPDLVLVIDHLAKPPFRGPGWDVWVRDLQAAANEPRVYAKLSGLDTAAGAGWSADELWPAIDIALEAFGPDRLLFGSDWPVCRQVSTYNEVVRATERWIEALSLGERERIMGGTAMEVYKLDIRLDGPRGR